jgi:hypothetical protein
MELPIERLPLEHRATIELVLGQARQECQPERCAIAPMLESCVCEAVAAIGPSAVPNYVPLLALRRVRACIRAGTCDTEEW